MIRLREKIIESILRLSAFSVIILLVLIFIFMAKEALPIITSPEIQKEVNFWKLFSSPFIWDPTEPNLSYSLIPLLFGTLKVTVIALFFAVPLGIGAAVFTSEFAPSYVKGILKPAIEILAGIPSVVLGFFALMVLADFWQGQFGWKYRLNVFNAGFALGLAVIPIIFTLSEDALSSVPRSFREASIAMGANKWQTASKIILPAASPGIFAACILGLGRAIGETMIVLLSCGGAGYLTLNITEPTQTLSITIAKELGEVIQGSPHYHTLYFIGVFLFIVTFIINLLGQWFIRHLQRRIFGKAAI